MLVMVVFFIAFRWIHLSTPLIRLFLLVLILLLMPTLNFLPVWFALSLLRFRLPSRLPIDRKSGSAGMPRPISYAVFCLKKKNNITLNPSLTELLTYFIVPVRPHTPAVTDAARCIFLVSACTLNAI